MNEYAILVLRETRLKCNINENKGTKGTPTKFYMQTSLTISRLRICSAPRRLSGILFNCEIMTFSMIISATAPPYVPRYI